MGWGVDDKTRWGVNERRGEAMSQTMVEMTTTTATEAADLKTLLDNYERELILAALQASGGHQRRAAACLGVLPTTLHEKMKRLGLLRPKPAVD
jgi:DNA-binding NtrC family response regulator